MATAGASRRPPYTLNDWRGGAPTPGDGWDCADAIDDGWSKDDLVWFMRETAEPWVPPAPPVAPEPRPAPGPRPAGPAPVAQARTVQQEAPEPATVTNIHTRATFKADDAWQMKLVTNAEGKMMPSVTLNWSLFLRNHPEMVGVFAYDAFKHKVMLMRAPPWDDEGAHWSPREVRDNDLSRAVMWLENFRMSPKYSNVTSVIQSVAEQSTFDRLTDYLDALKWDGEARIGRWMATYLGAADEDYAAIVGQRFLISAVARGLRPGCKVDTMPILEGPQGLKKSGALEALFGKDFFTDGLSDIGSKDAKMEMQGVWGLEVAEMHRFNAAATGDIKKFLTQKTDRYRPPYGKMVIESPRRVVLAGTINPDGNPYLKDSTGARRFWPVICNRIDRDGIERDRDQLWAEAVYAFRQGVPWWVQDDEMETVSVEQDKRTDVDVWTDVIAPALKGHNSMGQHEIFVLLGIPNKDADYRHAGRVGRIMKALGWVHDRDRHGDEDRVVYRKLGDAADNLSGDW